jgi:hypothetical protein
MSLKLNSSGGGSVTLQEPTTASNVTLNLPAADGTVNTSGAVNEVPAGSASAPSIYPTGDTNTGIFFPAADTIAFTEGGVESARIDSSGNLLVGKTTTASTTAGSVFSANDFFALSISQATGNRAVIFSNTSGTGTGNITINASTTSFNTSSDYRLKENVQPMTGALSKVAALKPVTYNWKATGEASEGFIAHELQEVVPECVTGEKDAVNEDGSIKPQGIDTSFLVATLTAAIQEQQAMIEELKAKVAALEAQ